MPRQARLDAVGALHHVIVRGIEKRRIVDNRRDCEDFVLRMGNKAYDSGTIIYAWSLMPNHAHILLRTASIGLAGYMHRFLTGYAIAYNKRHQRHGYLFQNRYKSIVCEEETYFRELIRYIHLNPLRAKVVKNLTELDRYPWCGHSVVMGKITNNWQDWEYVLRLFGEREAIAQKAYRKYIKEGIDRGRRPELVGGGLIRSQGGWSEVKSLRRMEKREESDERILGSGTFVKRIIQEADERTRYLFPSKTKRKKVEKYIKKVCIEEKISKKELQSGSRRRSISRVRNRIARNLIKSYGISLAESARLLGVSTSAISKLMSRAKEE